MPLQRRCQEWPSSSWPCKLAFHFSSCSACSSGTTLAFSCDSAISVCCSCSAKSSRGLALPGLEMAQARLGTYCQSNAPSRQQSLLRLIAFSQGKALWGNSKSLPHCSFCLLFGEEMKASVVSWPIILITFGHEAWLKQWGIFYFLSQAPKTRDTSTLFNFNPVQCSQTFAQWLQSMDCNCILHLHSLPVTCFQLQPVYTYSYFIKLLCAAISLHASCPACSLIFTWGWNFFLIWRPPRGS